MLEKLRPTKNTLLFLFASMILGACTKNKNTDTMKPLITMAEPMSDDTLSMAIDPEIHIEFTVTDDMGLHSLSVMLLKNNSDTLLNETPTVMDLKVFAFHEHLMATGIAALTPLTAIIKAEDHSHNFELKTIQFFIKP